MSIQTEPLYILVKRDTKELVSQYEDGEGNTFWQLEVEFTKDCLYTESEKNYLISTGISPYFYGRRILPDNLLSMCEFIPVSITSIDA